MVEHTYTDWLAPSFGANSCEGLSLCDRLFFSFLFLFCHVMLILSSMAPNFDRMQVFLGFKNSKLISKLKSSSQEKKFQEKLPPIEIRAP